jgi:hypothetical protein
VDVVGGVDVALPGLAQNVHFKIGEEEVFDGVGENFRGRVAGEFFACEPVVEAMA